MPQILASGTKVLICVTETHGVNTHDVRQAHIVILFSCGMIILYRNINMDPTWIMKKDKIARKCTNLICNSASHATEKNDKKPFPYENLILSCICLNSLRHTWVSKLTIICSDNGLSPGRRQGIIWTNAGKSMQNGDGFVAASMYW